MKLRLQFGICWICEPEHARPIVSVRSQRLLQFRLLDREDCLDLGGGEAYGIVYRTHRMANNLKPDSPLDLFIRWFVVPISSLKILPHGDGGFAAIFISVPLYERALHAALKLDGLSTKEQRIYEELKAENDKLSCPQKLGDDKIKLNSKVCGDLLITEETRRIFWSVFRTGMMHQGMPRTGKKGEYGWAFNASFSAFPEIRGQDQDRSICIDPWKFTDHVIRKFVNRSELITASDSFPFAQIFEVAN